MSIDITDATFDEKVLKSTLPVLVKFWAPWCGPCRAIAPAIDELSEELKDVAVIANINVDENPAIPTKFGIRAIPSFILFKDGNLVETVVGVANKSALKELIEQKG